MITNTAMFAWWLWSVKIQKERLKPMMSGTLRSRLIEESIKWKRTFDETEQKEWFVEA